MLAADLWKRAVAGGGPVVSPVDARGLVEVSFVWRGEAERTSVGWGSQQPMERAPGTDIWHRTFRLPATMRTIYYFSHIAVEEHRTPPDDSGSGSTHVDPLNADRMLFPGDPDDPSDRDGWVSVLTLPRAAPQPWCLPRPGVPAGTIQRAELDGGHRVAVYRPPAPGPSGAGGQPDERRAGLPDERRAGLPAVIVFDGYLARTMMAMPVTIDNLIAAGEIPPLVAIFVDGTDETRLEDLAPSSEKTTRFMIRELMPWARRVHGISPYPQDVALAGMSLGGLAAAALALRAPEVFGAVISHSGSYWWPKPADGDPGWLIREVTRRPRAGVRFYLDVGDRERQIFLPGVPDQVTVNRRMRDALRAKGYPVTYAEYPGEHDYVNWRTTFADGLRAVFGRHPTR